MNASRLTDYKAVREEIVKIVQAQRRWTSVDGEPSAEPMEVDSLGKAKSGKGKPGKSKNKGDGKSLVKGKTKDKATHQTSRKTEDENETRTCHYCHKAGHLAAACKKKARDEAKGKKTTAAITGAEASSSSAPPPAVASVTAARSYSPTQLAAAAAVLAQQALESRRSSAGQPVFEVSALTEARYDWPDTDEEIIICPLLPPVGIDMVQQNPGEMWALYDSGSGLTTCPADASRISSSRSALTRARWRQLLETPSVRLGDGR